ncbi:uncharacterized protein stbd1 [Osmerus mordax]|uniref:uncharacterized protein stbd1 n=1 Tax=Osmerus mordax TaxID=8014 RepID=UPI0035103990
MAIKKSKTVALEGRGDLTSLFSLMGRYAPAAALTVFAMLSLWAAFIIYRTISSRRRKAGSNVLVTEKDAVNPEGITPIEEETESSVESTEPSDEGLPEMMCSKSESNLMETNRSSDASEDDDADWLPLEENDPGFLPEHNSEPPERCPRPNQAIHNSDQQEPASDCSLSGKTNETGCLSRMEVQCQSQHSLKEFSLCWRCESTDTEEPGIHHPHALDKGEPEEGPDHLPELENGDGDLEGLQHGQVYVNQEVEISSHELTAKEKAWKTGAIVEDGSPHIPHVNRDQLMHLCVEYVKQCEVLDAYLPDECVNDPISQHIDWPEVVIGPQEPLVDQPRLKDKPYESLEEDPNQDSLHVNVIDQLNQLLEESDRNSLVQLSAPMEVHNGLIDEMGEQIFEPRVTGFNNQLSELTEARVTVTSMVDQFMEPTRGRNPLVVFEKVEMVKSLDTEEEVCYEKTEINIMEATMDNNEWMTVDITEETMRIVPLMTNSPLAALPARKCLQGDEQDTNNMPGDMNDPGSTDGDEGNKKVLVVQPLPQMIHVRFSVHYLTTSPCQVLAVTGDQKELGSWKSYVPLERAKDGFWANSVSLPADSQVEWKFVLVEDGWVKRWEECSNRHLETGHGQDVHVRKWWGYL